MIYVLIILSLVMVYLVIREFTNKPTSEKFAINDALLNHDELMKHAVSVAKNHVISNKRRNYNFMFSRLHENYRFILSVYKKLNEDAKAQISLCPASEWLLDNFYIIEEQYKDLKLNIVGDYYEGLRILDNGPLKGYPRIFSIGLELVSHTDGRVDKDQLVDFIESYQSASMLTMSEIWSLSSMIKISTMEKIRYVCEKIQSTQCDWEAIDALKKLPQDEFLQAIDNEINNMNALNVSFTEHLLTTLKKEELNSEQLLQKIATKLVEFDTTIDSIINLEHQEQAGLQITMGNCITSLRHVNTLDWEEIFEQVSMVEKILESDPSSLYREQDFETRDYYRHMIESLSKKLSVPETKIARTAVECARQTRLKGSPTVAPTHIGYYLVGEGRRTLLEQLGVNHGSWVTGKINADLYILSILVFTTLVSCSFIMVAYAGTGISNILAIAFFALLFWIPSSELVINIINKIMTKCKSPAFLPKLEFRNGIPTENKTMVIVPTLIPNPKRVTELINQLEVTYLSNYEDNILFALVGDLKDSKEQHDPDDDRIISLAVEKINALNKKYGNKFFFFMRERNYNPSCGKWMGWERKRGAIVELNSLLSGSEHTTYSTICGDAQALSGIRYILTLDADSILPIGTARKLIGTIAHPINKAVYDKDAGIVVSGYGIIQPRIGINIQSANKSLFSRIFAGQGGVDSYTNAISDVYQDMFCEGIFTGKGIYDLDIFVNTLNLAIPDNTVLSHDLLEGSYLRVGLASDIEIIDNFPEKYNSYTMRLHRWVRGDWQLIRWLFPSIRNKEGLKIKNPLSSLSRWKIFDNLRRSLVSPALMLIFASSIFVVESRIIFWIGFAMTVLFFPLVFSFLDHMKLPAFGSHNSLVVQKEKLNGNLIYGFKSTLYETILNFTFLPYHAYLMTGAILKTLYRVFISKRNMLEWVTAADAEKNARNDLFAYVKRMAPPIIVLYLIFLGAMISISPFNPMIFLLVAVWSISPYIAYKISKPTLRMVQRADYDTELMLRRISRKTWHFYETFSDKGDNYLPPDNYQILPVKRTAHRTSPTNIGLLFVSTNAAYDMGYFSLSRMLDRLANMLDTVEKLDKWNGHLYNWYDTITLDILTPRYISTVDSGNFTGYLITLKSALEEILEAPLISISKAKGLYDTVLMFAPESPCLAMLDRFFAENQEHSDIVDWYKLLTKLLEVHSQEAPSGEKDLVTRQLNDLMIEVRNYFAVITITNSDIEIIRKSKFRNSYNDFIHTLVNNPSPSNMLHAYASLQKKLVLFIKASPGNKHLETFARLSQLVEDTLTKLKELTMDIHQINTRISRLIDDTSFVELYDPKIGLFSIGYNIESNNLTNSYYDLLASEARITSYIAIARREIPVSHWFKLGRSLAQVDGYKSLVSWTGTMFEYFMPPLIMNVFENTLLDETYKTVLRAQANYGKKRNVPWGTSESGFHTFDLMLNYQYKAFGVPELGLKRGLVNDMVVSPYSTVLGLPFAPVECARNLKSLISNGLEGDYGLYEAVDFTPDRIPANEDKAIVQSFMAHHQGMIMIALDNYFNNNTMVRRFHRSPTIKAGEFLLQERIPVRLLITKEHKEIITPLEKIAYSTPTVTRIIREMDAPLPECHLLSNSNYVLMLTSKGQSYSRKDDMYITRWREGVSTNSGFFIFLNEGYGTSSTWNPTYEPLCDDQGVYETKFSPDKAEYFRRDTALETHMEICVSPEDNCEIRKVTFLNSSTSDTILECTSYSEIVLAHLMADIAHPSFNSLFIRTEAIHEFNGLVASKRSRENGGTSAFAFHSIFCASDCVGALEYETDRYKFIGRGRTLKTAAALDHPLSNSVGSVLDPVFSLRKKIRIPAGKSVVVSFILGVADTREGSIELMKKYSEQFHIERAFELSYIRSQMSSKYLNLKNSEIELYDSMLSHIVFISPLKKKYQACSLINRKGQSSLWSHGISGDLPIVLVTINDTEDIEIVKSMVKAHEYWRTKGIRVDLVILNEDENSYIEPLQNLIRDIVLSSNSKYVLNSNGGIFIRSARIIPPEDSILFYSVARIVIKAEIGNIRHQIQNAMAPVTLPADAAFQNISYPVAQGFPEIKPDLQYYNEYGGFDVTNGEYVIRLCSSTQTPTPWINVIANKKFGFIETENGSGYTWSMNSRENKLTNWSNDPVSDPPSEILYIRDDITGKLWTITPLPIRENEDYVIRHGAGYTSFHHFSNGIDQELTVFVPINDEKVKISMVKLSNKSLQTRELSVFYYVKPVLGSSEQLSQAHISTALLENTGIFTARNCYNPDFSNSIMFIDSSLSKESYTGDQSEFIGNCGCVASPTALKRSRLSGNVGSGCYPCCAIHSKLILAPGQEMEFTMLLGESDSTDEIQTIVSKYSNLLACTNALTTAQEYWKSTLGTVQVNTPEPSMNIIMNSWLMYQTIACRLWARSAFYQSGGAYGFRDQLQDVLSLANTMPEAVRNQILLHCEHQFVEGDVQHWWHPYANNKGIRTRFSDDLLWLPFTVAEYVRITGDEEILNLQAGFLEDDPLGEHEDERYGLPKQSQHMDTVYSHCLLAIERALKFGDHGIPLMGSGDWNDGMNTVGNKGRGESVWMGWFLCTVLSSFSELCKLRNDLDTATRYQKISGEIAANIEQNAWDGKWYRRAYFDDGTPLGSSLNRECSIDSLAQSWAAISGFGDNARTKTAMESLENHLIKRDSGLILLFTPPFDNGDLKPGYIKGYVPGVRENGGQYTHAAVWVIYAFTKMGDGDKAYECFKLINPITHTMTKLDCARYKVEPYVLAADVYNVDIHNGRGGWTWYTGSSSWMYKVGLEKILGFNKNGNVLTIDPCIPKSWPEYSIVYKQPNATFQITIRNPAHVHSGIVKMAINGNQVPDYKINLNDYYGECLVDIELG